MTSTAEHNENLARRTLAAVNDMDFDTVREVHAPEVILYENGEEYGGYDAVEEHAGALLQLVDAATVTVADVIADGDRVACRCTVDVTAGGDSIGVSALVSHESRAAASPRAGSSRAGNPLDRATEENHERRTFEEKRERRT